MGIFIAVIIVLLILIYLMLVILKSVVSEANRKVETYFLGNLKEYDSRFDKRFSDLNEMYVEYEQMSKKMRIIQNELEMSRTSKFYAPRPLQRDIYIPTARYIDNDFFEEYKIAKDKLMGIDKQQVIDNVMNHAKYVGDRQKYDAIESIIKKVNFDAMYDLCSISGEEQLEILRECLDEQELTLIDEFFEEEEDGEFDILAFFDYLRRIKEHNDPHVFVYVGVNEKDYTNEERMIVCGEDMNICEGLKIIYQHMIYDYSIYKSRKKSR